MRRTRRAFLLPMSFLILSTAVFGWGLQYKLSLYHGKDPASHRIPEAKLLSQKERPQNWGVLVQRPHDRPHDRTVDGRLDHSSHGTDCSFSPALRIPFAQAHARLLRLGAREPSQLPLPACLRALFLRPPPILG